MCEWFERYNLVIFMHLFFFVLYSSFDKREKKHTYSLKVPVSGSSVITSCSASTQMLMMPQNLSWITLMTHRQHGVITQRKMGSCPKKQMVIKSNITTESQSLCEILETLKVIKWLSKKHMAVQRKGDLCHPLTHITAHMSRLCSFLFIFRSTFHL